MAQQNDPEIQNPFKGSMSEMNLPVQQQMAPTGSATDQAQAQIITAQRVAVKRDTGRVLKTIQELGMAAGQKYYYSIPFRNKRKGTTEYVEGGTIKMAVDLAREYGNCTAGAIVDQESPTHWTFRARFIDYETGFTYERSFQQRKGQNTGMSDQGRAEDLIFQIGQSKAIRNVVLGALATYADEMFDAAKSGIVDRIGRNLDGARTYLQSQFGDMDIPIAWVERVVGRKADQWNANDMARLYGRVNAIKEGFMNASEAFPDPATVDEETGEITEEPKSKAKSQSKPAASKQQAKPKAQQQKKQETKKQEKKAEEPAPAADPGEEEAGPEAEVAEENAADNAKDDGQTAEEVEADSQEEAVAPGASDEPEPEGDSQEDGGEEENEEQRSGEEGDDEDGESELQFE